MGRPAGIEERHVGDPALAGAPPVVAAVVDLAVDLDGAGVRLDDLAGWPICISRPWLNHATRSQRFCTAARPWLTSTIVLPLLFSSANFSLHLRWKASSPTASTSSTSRTSGSTLMATEKPSRTYMPDE